MVSDLVEAYGAAAVAQVLDAFKDLGLPLRDPGRDHDLQERHRLASQQGGDPRSLRGAGAGDPGPVRGGLHHRRGAQGGSHRALGQGDRGGRSGDGGQPPRAEPDLHDGQLGRPRIVQADPPARRHAGPDGQPEGRDHRAADQGQLHGGPVGARVLHLDPRRPQGARRHGAPDRRLRLSDAAPRRRRPGRDRPGRGLQDQGVRRDAAPRGRRRAEREPGGTRVGEEVRHQARPRAAEARAGDRPARAGGDRGGLWRGRGGPRPRPLGAQVRARVRRVPGLLRARDGHRLGGRAGRRRRDHRGPIDRRARHPADHAHVPHRRRRRSRHHAGPAARRRAVRGA